MGWTARDIPDLSGKTIIVTGANSGLGFETAKALAGRNATVILACRNQDKGRDAVQRIQSEHGDAKLQLAPLDLAALSSVRAFAEQFAQDHDKLDVLCNNAGIMAVPRRETADGFEMQIGTNHFGHFALTGLLLDRLAAADRARVVTVSSMMHYVGKIRFDDIQRTRFYEKWSAYGQSKLANLLFTYELQRRFDASGASTIAVAAHPGYASTNLQFQGTWATSKLLGLTNGIAAQSAAMGALPTLFAATAAEVRGGDYFGPDGFMEMTGHPKRVKSTKRSRDRDAQRRLFDMSEDLTNVTYAF